MNSPPHRTRGSDITLRIDSVSDTVRCSTSFGIPSSRLSDRNFGAAKVDECKSIRYRYGKTRERASVIFLPSSTGTNDVAEDYQSTSAIPTCDSLGAMTSAELKKEFGGYQKQCSTRRLLSPRPIAFDTWSSATGCKMEQKSFCFKGAALAFISYYSLSFK